jgi:hypothetical protein
VSDYGMTIVRGTPCAVGRHVWIVSGNSTKNMPIPPERRCECGAHTYEDYCAAHNRCKALRSLPKIGGRSFPRGTM